MMSIVEGKSYGDGATDGVVVGSGVTHAVWSSLTLLPAGQQVHFDALGPEYSPGGHFLHFLWGEGE